MYIFDYISLEYVLCGTYISYWIVEPIYKPIQKKTCYTKDFDLYAKDF